MMTTIIGDQSISHKSDSHKPVTHSNLMGTPYIQAKAPDAKPRQDKIKMIYRNSGNDVDKDGIYPCGNQCSGRDG